MKMTPRQWSAAGNGRTRSDIQAGCHRVAMAAQAHCDHGAQPVKVRCRVCQGPQHEHKRPDCHLVAWVVRYHSAPENFSKQPSLPVAKVAWIATSLQSRTRQCLQCLLGRVLVLACTRSRGRTCLRTDTTRKDMALHDSLRLQWGASNLMALAPLDEYRRLVDLELRVCTAPYKCLAPGIGRLAVQTFTTASDCRQEVQAIRQYQSCRLLTQIPTGV